VAGTPVPPFLSRDGQDIVHENPEQKYLNANKIIEIKKKEQARRRVWQLSGKAG
jgi:hypothetical protein